MAEGLQVRNPYAPPPPPVTSPLINQYKLYNSGVQQNAEDYSGIMQGYRNLSNDAGRASTPIAAQSYTPQQIQSRNFTYTPTQIAAPTPINAQSYNYQPSSDVTQSLGQLKDLSQTGGYSEQNIADLRARGISPIRAIYANAQRDLTRQRSLQGGYSPNYGAVSAKMAREQSDQIGTATQNVNAGIAQNIAQNRLSVAPNYASAAGSELGLRTNVGENNVNAQNNAQIQNIANQIAVQQANAAATNRAGEFNVGNNQQTDIFNASAINNANQMTTQNKLEADRLNAQQQEQNRQRQLAALSGMSSLYGTTPAMSNLFGNQAMNAAQFENQVQQQQNQQGLDLVGRGISSIPRFG